MQDIGGEIIMAEKEGDGGIEGEEGWKAMGLGEEGVGGGSQPRQPDFIFEFLISHFLNPFFIFQCLPFSFFRCAQVTR